MRKLDWKWIAIGVVIMVVLTFIAGLILTFLLGPQIAQVNDAATITLSNGQILLVAVVNILVFAVGGFIVGVKSIGRTIIEPGISAAIAVLIGLVISGNFTIVNLLVGGVVPFLAGVVGGWLGERQRRTRGF